MLVLSRKIGEVVVIGNTISITVLGFDRGFVKLGIEAPRSIPVHRQEIYEKIIDINRQAASTELSALRTALQKSGLRNEMNDREDQHSADVNNDIDSTTSHTAIRESKVRREG